MSSGDTKEMHLLDLPSEVLYEIMKRLDYTTRQDFGRTCKYLDNLVKKFESKRNYLPPDSDDDDDMYFDAHHNDAEDDDTLDDLDQFANFDQLSFGSNYDEELDDYLNDNN